MPACLPVPVRLSAIYTCWLASNATQFDIHPASEYTHTGGQQQEELMLQHILEQRGERRAHAEPHITYYRMSRTLAGWCARSR